jgi:hypothetical protein
VIFGGFGNTDGLPYAEAGIPEYWILNIPEGILEVGLILARGSIAPLKSDS